MSETKTAVKPKTKGKKALKVIGIILAVIVALCLIGAVVSLIGNSANTKKARSFDKIVYENQLVPELDEFGNYVFTADRDLKVLQLTDVHIGGGWMSLKKDAMALNAVAAMVTAEKPDLVIVTGDIGYPVPFQAGTFNNKASAKIFTALMEQLGAYWTLAFGNHDTEAYSYYSREKMAKFYSDDDLQYCLFQSGPDEVDGYGNQIITVRNSKGIITQEMYLFDSHSYTDGDFLGVMWKYDNIHPNQVEWYAENIDRYQKLNDEKLAAAGEEPSTEPITSTLYFHIPLTEYKDAWYEYIDSGFKDTENVKYHYGTAGEGKKVVYCGVGDDDLFETVQKLGSTKAIFCGHDHYNYFSIDYKGIRLTYGRSIDYLAYPGIYKEGTQRGCTVITLSPDGSFDCKDESYYQEKYTSLYDTEQVTMQEIVPVSERPTE
ncbi:MAG: metallophosphoesterase [Clostridia bacterium]|nr:metallophosphoesterase [Clostridia bacterium]